MFDKMDQLCVNTIRTLSMDGVQAADSGHPGIPMAMAPVAYTLWQQHLRFDPNDPVRFNRDRFVLSAGHPSMLFYALLHLTAISKFTTFAGSTTTTGSPSRAAPTWNSLKTWPRGFQVTGGTCCT